MDELHRTFQVSGLGRIAHGLKSIKMYRLNRRASRFYSSVNTDGRGGGGGGGEFIGTGTSGFERILWACVSYKG